MKKLTALLLAVLMLCSLCACGSSDKSVSAPAAMYENASYDSAEVATAGAYGGFAVSEDMTAADGGSGETPDTDPEKIIYSADATLETTTFEDSCAAVLELVEKYGGWVESSSINGANHYSKSTGASYNRSAYYQLRIPSDKFATLMGELPTLGNVPYSHTYTENVTAQYYDLDARLTAYQTQETRLLEMMEKAETVSDIITIEDRLTELRYQIESIQTSLNSWDRQVSYSSVGLSVEEVRDYTPEAAESFGQRLWQSLVGGLKAALDFIKEALVFIVGALPLLIVLGVIVFAVVLVIKKLRKTRKARKEKKNAPLPEEEKK